MEYYFKTHKKYDQIAEQYFMTKMIVNFVCHMSPNACKTCHFDITQPMGRKRRQFAPILPDAQHILRVLVPHLGESDRNHISVKMRVSMKNKTPATSTGVSNFYQRNA